MKRAWETCVVYGNCLETWHGQIDTVIAIEGHGVDEVRHAGIGSTRLQVVFEGPGGHSWGAFGTPSAIHAMGTAIHHLAHLPVATDPKTTYNIGVVEGGDSVNTIAPQASMLVDLRSVHPKIWRTWPPRWTRCCNK